MEYLIEIFCLTFVFGYLFYKWANNNYECFSKRNVAHEKPVFLVGNNLTVLEGKESSPEFLIRLHRQFKDQKIYGHYEFRSPLFFIRDPELIHRIVIKDFDSFTNRPENNALLSNETTGSMLSELKDEKWTEMREILTRAFQEKKINQVYQTISECQKEAIKHLKRTIKSDGKEINFAGYFQRYSNDVVASAAFGLDINSYKDENNEFSEMSTTLLRTRSLCAAIKSFYLTIFPQVLRIYRLNRIYIKIMAYIRNLFSRKIKSPYKEKIDTENSVDQKKEGMEFLQIIKGLFRKSSSAIISLVLTVFPQISFIFYIYGFVQSIRNYIRSIFNPKLRQRQEIPTKPYQDIEVSPVQKRNQFLKIGIRAVRNITASIKLMIFSLFPQILWISRIYFITKTVINYLRGKPNKLAVEPKSKNQKKKLSKMEAALMKFERFVIVVKILVLTYFPKISKVIKLSAFNSRALNYIKSLAQQSIQKRQDGKIIRNYMIQLMFEAQKCEENSFESEENSIIKEISNKFTEDELIAQCILFLFSGLEPITKALCSTVYELMQNPEIQEKLFEEINTVHSDLNGSEITYEIVDNLKYLDMVISETLRKWPIQPLLSRVCSKPYSLVNGEGEIIADFKPGDNVCFSVYGSHFDDEYFENPFTFDPERFNDKNKANIRLFTYFPFGVGARSCIGYKFGLMAVKIMLYQLVLEFKFASGSKTIPDLFAVHRKIQLKQSDFYWMTILPRVKEEKHMALNEEVH